MTSTLVISGDKKKLDAYVNDIVRRYKSADVFWLLNDQTIGVKDVVEFLEHAHLSPVGDKKLMIINDFACVTPQAQNKMLKTIEDAPGKTDFLFLATTIEPVLNTIKSRCVTTYLPIKSGAPLVPADVIKTCEKAFGVKFDESTLTIKQKQDIMNAVATFNKRVNANCNEEAQKDLLIMEILKYAKNS